MSFGCSALSGNSTEEGTEKLQDPEGRGKCYEILPSGYDMTVKIMNTQKL